MKINALLLSLASLISVTDLSACQRESPCDKLQNSVVYVAKLLCYKSFALIHNMRPYSLVCHDHSTMLQLQYDLDIDRDKLDHYSFRYSETTGEGRHFQHYETPLHIAIRDGNLKCAQFLLNHGADKSKKVKKLCYSEGPDRECGCFLSSSMSATCAQHEETKESQKKEKPTEAFGLSCIELAKNSKEEWEKPSEFYEKDYRAKKIATYDAIIKLLQ